MIACLCPAIVRSYCWLICDVSVTYVRDGQTESVQQRARAYEYPVIGSIQQTMQQSNSAFSCQTSGILQGEEPLLDLPLVGGGHGYALRRSRRLGMVECSSELGLFLFCV